MWKFGLLGTSIGLLALSIAVFHFFLGPIEKPPSIEEHVADLTVRLKDAVTAKLKGTQYQPSSEARQFGLDEFLDFLVIAIGFLAIVFGVIGFVRKEQWRPSGAAVVLGGAAITFQFAITVVAAVLVIFLIVMILQQLGLG